MRNDINRRSALAALASTMLAACGGGYDLRPWYERGTEALSEWSAIATATVLAEAAARPPGLSPMEESRIYAMAFIAACDALNVISYRYGTYVGRGKAPVPVPDADADVAVAAAVHAVLRNQLPNQAGALDAALVASLSRPTVGDKTLGINLGQDRARQILALRANDGSANAYATYLPGLAPGDYQPTAPDGAAKFVNWGRVTPFALSSGSEFRAPPPYSIGDAAYAADFAEVQSLGGVASTQRTADQTEIARFWLESPALSWQRLAADLADPQPSEWLQPWTGHTAWTQAALFAMLQIAIADSYIAALDSKYAYNFWRPSTAIHAAETDGNPDTVADANWEPLGPFTPPVPEYVSAHAAAAMAGARVLGLFFGPQESICTSTSLPGAQRRFNGFEAMAREIGLSQIYAGLHFRRAIEQGWALGDKVGDRASWIYDDMWSW